MAFSRFLCLLGEIVSYLFSRKRPTTITFPGHTGKVGTTTLRWEARPGTLRWDPNVRPSSGTLTLDPRVGPSGETLVWDLSETVKPDGLVLFMKKLLKSHLWNGKILNLNERKEKNNWIGLVSTCYNTVMRKQQSAFGKLLYKSVSLGYFRIKFF